MNKTQLIDAVALEAGIPRPEAKRAVDSIIQVITSTLQKGEKVSILGFGAFTVSDKPARQGRNPRTGEAIDIEAKRGIRFKAGSELTTSLK